MNVTNPLKAVPCGIARIAPALVVSLLLLGCGKNEDPGQSSESILKPEQPRKAPPVEGKWVTDSGQIIELRPDGRCTVEPFSGNQTVGNYTWNAANKEVVLSLNTGLGKLDALWPVQMVNNDSFTIDVRDERILGKRGQFKFSRFREGQPELKAEGQTFRAVEGLSFEHKAQVKMANVGTGTLLLKTGRNNYDALFQGESVTFSLDLKSDPRQAGDALTKDVDYIWKKPSGETLEGRVECKVIVEVAEATRLELGKAVVTDPKFSWQWFQFEIPSRDSAGKNPDMYAVVRTPTGGGGFFDAKRTGNAPMSIIGKYTLGTDWLAWIGEKPEGSCLWRVQSAGKNQTLALMPARYALKQIERVSGPSKALSAGEVFTLNGSECPESSSRPHSACWAAISFEAKAGRLYVNAISNTAREAGWSASAWFLSDEKYQQFRSANSSGSIDFYRSDLLGRWYSTLNSGEVPLWTAPSDGTFWILLHYGKYFSSDHFKDDCKVWLYEIPAYSKGEFSFSGSK